MKQCYDEGTLRAYIDDALAIEERRTLAMHLAGCADCRQQVDQVRAVAAQVETVLQLSAEAPDPQLALARLRQARRAAQAAPQQQDSSRSMVWRNTMQYLNRIWTGPRRMVATSLAAVVLVLSLLAFPPVRAAANRLLDVFRVQRVVMLPISPERIAQLENLDLDGKTLFVGEPKLVNQPAPPRTVESAAKASQAVGFTVVEPAEFPSAPNDSHTRVVDRTVLQFQVNVEGARELLTLLDVHDVTLPDALGEQPITADISASVQSRYHGPDYTLELYQGHSPTMTLPEGTDLRQLGRAALRLLGMPPSEAETLSRQIDWSSTLIFPIPPDVSDVRQVMVGDTQGMLVGSGSGSDRDWLLYWQRGDQFYVLEGHGELSEMNMTAAANSVR